jgi:hypothetical protein
MEIAYGIMDAAVVGGICRQLFPFGNCGVILPARYEKLGLLKNFAAIRGQHTPLTTRIGKR